MHLQTPKFGKRRKNKQTWRSLRLLLFEPTHLIFRSFCACEPDSLPPANRLPPPPPAAKYFTWLIRSASNLESLAACTPSVEHVLLPAVCAIFVLKQKSNRKQEYVKQFNTINNWCNWCKNLSYIVELCRIRPRIVEMFLSFFFGYHETTKATKHVESLAKYKVQPNPPACKQLLFVFFLFFFFVSHFSRENQRSPKASKSLGQKAPTAGRLRSGSKL